MRTNLYLNYIKMLGLKNKVTKLRKSRLGAAQDRYNSAYSNYEDVRNTNVEKQSGGYNRIGATPAWDLYPEDNRKFDNAYQNMYEAKRNLEKEKKRARDYARARANGQKLLRKQGA